MTVTCEEIEFCKVKVNFIADSDLVSEKSEDIIKHLKSMNVKVPGFRKTSPTKGKKRKQSKNFKNSEAYERALKSEYRSYINDNVRKELVSEGIDEAIFETKMTPIGYPDVSNVMYDGKTFSCDMVFLKKPDFELKQYKGFNVPKPHVEETPDVMAEAMIQELRVRHGDVVTYEENDFLQDGDQVSMDVKATIGDDVVDNLTQQGLLYTVGSQTYAEFDNNLYGMKCGENRKFDIVFPEDEQVNENLRNKRVSFDVTLHMGTKRVPHPLDDELAKKVGFKSFDELHQNAVSIATNKLQAREQALLAQQVTTRLLENNQFEVPSWLVLMESQNMARNMKREWSDLSTEEIEMLNESAKKSVRLSLILDSIREVEKESSFSPEEIINKLRMQLMSQGQDPDQILSQAGKDGTLLGEVTRLRDEATVQWIIKNSEIVE